MARQPSHNQSRAEEAIEGAIDSCAGSRGAAQGSEPTSEEQFRLIVDSIPGFVFTTNPEGRGEFVNRQTLEYFGCTLDELQQWELSDVVHLDDVEAMARVWRQNIAAGTPFVSEQRLRRADGAYRWFQLRCSPAIDASGRIIRWYGCLTDIDSLKAAESASREDLRSLSLLIDSIPGLLFTTRANGELEWVNRTILAYFGRSLEDLQNWRLTDAVHPEDLPNTLARWSEGAASGQPYDFEERLRRHDGVYRWFHFRAAPMRDDKGQIVRWYGLVTDIDDLKRTREEARLNERQLSLILDNIPGLVFTLTPAGEMEQANQRILDLFGATFEELSDWRRVTHPEDVAPVRARIEHSLRTGELLECESRGLRADGVYRWFQTRGLPLRDTDGKILRWYCLLIDVTDLKRAEEGLRSVQARLSKAAQVAAVSELAATIAHEVNQPLSAVVAAGHACHRWLSATPPNVERALVSAERIIRDGKSAASIVTRVRSLFRHAVPAKLRLQLNTVIEEVCTLVTGDLRTSGVALTLQLQPDLPPAAADRIQMQQVVFNLIRNGIEAMDGVEGRSKTLTISSAVAGGEVVVCVTDAGVGLEHEDSVFEPFFTTKANGMGMGLAICKSILEAHGGRVWAARNREHGATFAFAVRTAEAGVDEAAAAS
jgi:PAS domain S-box-containing protein